MFLGSNFIPSAGPVVRVHCRPGLFYCESNMFLAEKRNKNKTVLDWHELEAAVTERRRLKRTTPESERCAVIAESRYGDGHWAHLHDRLVAFGRDDSIELAYLHHSPGTAVSEDKLEGGRAFVYPAAGGRTQYKVCESARGHFMNRWLPFNAGDRETKSNYRNWKFAWGAGGMYQEGLGPVLLDCGIAALQKSPTDMLPVVAAAGEWVSDEFRAAATRLLEAFAGWQDTFEDTRFKFAMHGLAKRERLTPDMVSLRPYREYGASTSLLVSHSLTVRLRRPFDQQNGRFNAVPDFAVIVIPQPEDLGFGPKAMYSLARMPVGSGGESMWDKSEQPAKLLTTSLSDVMHVAREFSAASVFIPAL